MFTFLQKNDPNFLDENKNISNDKFHKVVFLKIMVNMLQIMSLIKNMNLDWATTINGFFFAHSKVGDLSEQLFSFDCLISNSFDLTDLFYLKLILVFFLPFMSILIFLSFFIFIGKFRKNFPDFVLCSFCIVSFSLQPIILQKSFLIFSCTEIETNKFYITSSLINECFDRKYYKYVNDLIIFFY